MQADILGRLHKFLVAPWDKGVSTMRLCKKSDFDIITFHLTKCKWVNCILERYGKTKKFVKKIC